MGFVYSCGKRGMITARCSEAGASLQATAVACCSKTPQDILSEAQAGHCDDRQRCR